MRRHRDENVASPPRDEQRRRAAEQREEETLGQQLAHDPRAVGADREAQRHLASPRDAAREQEVGHVDADDGEEQRDAEHERDEWIPERVAHTGEPARTRCEREREASILDLAELVGLRRRANRRFDDG